MMPALRRIAALALLVLLLAAAWVGLLAPVIGLARDRMDDSADLIRRRDDLDMILARRPVLQRESAALKARLSGEDGFWAGTSAPAIAASVQDRLRDVVVAHGGVVKTAAEMRPASASASADTGTPAIRVRFRIEGALDTIRETLAAIETSRPALFVDGLTIAGLDGDGTPDRAPLLLLDLDVTAFRAPPRS